MNLKINLGEIDRTREGLFNNELNTVFENDNCIVQADVSISTYNIGMDKNILIFGKIIEVNAVNKNKLNMFDEFQTEIIKCFANGSIDESVRKVEGRFIYVYIDNGCVTIGTDKFGEIDLYYQHDNKEVVLSSQLGLLPFIDDANIEYDQVAAAHSLYIYGYRPAKKQTLYSKIKRLGVNERCVWKDELFEIRKIKYITYYTSDFNYAEGHDTYANLFLEAVEKRSSPNGNIVYLSSGWDSTSILSSLVHMYGANKTRAVIGRMNFSREAGVCNPYEISRAQKIADYFGIKLEIVEFDYYQRGPELTEKHADFMKNNMVTSMSLYQWIDLANYVANNSDSEPVFSGEISDGAHNFGFSQSLTVLDHPVHEFREYSDKMASYIFGPSFMKTMTNGSFNEDSVYNFLKDRHIDGIFDPIAKKNIGKIKQLLSSLFLRDVRFPLWSLDNSKFFTANGRELYQNEMSKLYIDDISNNITDKNLYSYFIDLYKSFHWNGGTVSTLYMTGDLYGIDINLPFKDSKLLKFLSEMPESWGRGLEMRPTKYPLKHFLKNKIDYPYHLQSGPHSYLYDTNHEFDHAAEWNYRSAFSEQYRTILAKREYRDILSKDYFNIRYLDKIVENYLSGKEVKEEKHYLENLIYFSVMGFYGT